MWVTNSTTQALTPTAVALGNFDGLHRGHQQVIQPVLHQVSSQRIYATVVTFSPHPQEFFSGQRRALLTPLKEKVSQLMRLGLEQLVLLPFDRELASLNPQDFVEKILVKQLHCHSISVGQDFCFGKQRSGNATDLQAIAANFGIPVTIVPIYACEGERISSSSIRHALEQGDLQGANLMLGRSYVLTGKVVKGQQLGRTIGFPTANLQLSPDKFLPRKGVYTVKVFIEDDVASNPEEILAQKAVAIGVMNIGDRPTVNGQQLSVEVHLLDWSGDLYGKTLVVELEAFLRPEQKFSSLEALKAQIAADCDMARSQLMLEQSNTFERIE